MRENDRYWRVTEKIQNTDNKSLRKKIKIRKQILINYTQENLSWKKNWNTTLIGYTINTEWQILVKWLDFKEKISFGPLEKKNVWLIRERKWDYHQTYFWSNIFKIIKERSMSMNQVRRTKENCYQHLRTQEILFSWALPEETTSEWALRKQNDWRDIKIRTSGDIYWYKQD